MNDKNMNSKKKLAILGANESISFLIRKAKEMGFETHVFAWKCGDPGEEEADYFYPISISNKNEILKKCEEIGICGICSITSDYASPIVSYIARKLNLPGNPEITDIVARNKYKMRLAFKKYGGIYSPKFLKADLNFDCESLNDFKFPVIVKPTDRWSSKGITRVDKLTDLKAALEIAINESFEKKAIIEEFIEGPEYSAECIVFNGETNVLAFTKKETTGFPHYIETGHTQPSDLSEEQKKNFEIVIKRAISALSITNSAAHVEFRVMPNGELGFMEIGARMGGDYIGTDLTPISTGKDYLRMVIDVACGKQPCLDIVTSPFAVAVKFIINRDDVLYFNSIDPKLIIRKSDFDTNFDNECVDSSTRHGYYIVRV